ncbi:FAD-dependent oxidoreductase [Aquincola sp. MAHUQ-54]|uniref:FAD-dependent oxidoreductase n=1 Tax=Aquincola agrisoli TaxID=3119538 RepID=A0AAW9QFD2_9BURK
MSPVPKPAVRAGGLARRDVLAGLCAAPWLAGCTPPAATGWAGGWVGARAERGHLLRGTPGAEPAAPALQRRAAVLVVGAGVAGLAAARALVQGGVDDVQVFDLEDQAGGNSRGHAMGGMACPLGAHYLPLPGPGAPEVAEWLAELGVSRQEAGRTVYDERHLCHSPQERLFIDGAWHEGLLPPAEPGSRTLASYRRFAAAVRDVQRALPFAVPTLGTPWYAGHAALDAQTFSAWLQVRQFDDARLVAYLDYCCRDDYGAGIATVSAWAGLHYFASRHGFHAPGEEAEPEPVLTWPEGNGWLVRHLAQAVGGDRLHTGCLVQRVVEERHGVRIDVWNAAAERAERWTADHAVLALPLFVAARVLQTPPPALAEAAAVLRYAPWLVANLQLGEALLDRPGAPPSWDNVLHGSRMLGYVDAMHQRTRPHAGPTVLTAYWALPQDERSALLLRPWEAWAQAIVDELSLAHPDLPRKVVQADLMRYGHAMSIPVPGVRGHAALRALGEPQGRLHFVHADLSGCSMFEEAFTRGTQAGRRIAAGA